MFFKWAGRNLCLKNSAVFEHLDSKMQNYSKVKSTTLDHRNCGTNAFQMFMYGSKKKRQAGKKT
jgi:hypothetical protein